MKFSLGPENFIHIQYISHDMVKVPPNCWESRNFSKNAIPVYFVYATPLIEQQCDISIHLVLSNTNTSDSIGKRFALVIVLENDLHFALVIVLENEFHSALL